MRSAAGERAQGTGHSAGGKPFNSCFDIFEFSFRFNPGTNGGNVEMGLTDKGYKLLLISGSKVRVLVRPPLFLKILNGLEGQLCAPPLAGVCIGNALSNV